MTAAPPPYSDIVGWRARIGVVVPSPNAVLEPLYNRIVPAGITVHFSRMFLENAGRDELLEMDRTAGMDAIRDVASCGSDALIYACTASSVLQPPGYDDEMIEKMTSSTGKPSTTVTESIRRGLEAFGAKRIVIVSPYVDEIDRAERTFFERAGYEVAATRSLGIADARELASPGPEEIYRLAKETWDPSADALVVSCANFRSHDVIEALEADLGVPVITSTQAPLWRALRMAGVPDAIESLGRLFREPGPA